MAGVVIVAGDGWAVFFVLAVVLLVVAFVVCFVVIVVEVPGVMVEDVALLSGVFFSCDKGTELAFSRDCWYRKNAKTGSIIRKTTTKKYHGFSIFLKITCIIYTILVRYTACHFPSRLCCKLFLFLVELSHN